jgi:hypothetical protein
MLEKLSAKLVEIMESFGLDTQEVGDYSSIKLEGNIVTVTAEVSYKGLMIIAEGLDAIIQEVDKNAYFEAEEPGILSAALSN